MKHTTVQDEPMKFWHYCLIVLVLIVPFVAGCAAKEYFQTESKRLVEEYTVAQAEVIQAEKAGEITEAEKDQRLAELEEEFRVALEATADTAIELGEAEKDRIREGGEEFTLTLLQLLLAAAGFGAAGVGASAAAKRVTRKKSE